MVKGNTWKSPTILMYNRGVVREAALALAEEAKLQQTLKIWSGIRTGVTVLAAAVSIYDKLDPEKSEDFVRRISLAFSYRNNPAAFQLAYLEAFSAYMPEVASHPAFIYASLAISGAIAERWV